jgi:aspartate 1-decarboxylase
MTEQMINQMFIVLAAIATQKYTIGEISAKYANYGDIVILAAYAQYEEDCEHSDYEGD